MDVILTAAVTANGMIAHGFREIVRWSRDLPLFREQTVGQTVIMGSNTASTLATSLRGREAIVMHRDMDPAQVLSKVKTERCFIIGGSRTYARFVPHLTHIYLTYHPLVFRSNSVPLFADLDRDMNLEFEKMVEVDQEKGIYQFQYRVVDNYPNFT